MKSTYNYTGEGKKLYEAILSSQYRITEVYKHLGVSRATLYNYFAKSIIDDDFKIKVSKLLSKTVYQLFGTHLVSQQIDHIASSKLTPGDVLELNESYNTKNTIPYYNIDIMAGNSPMYNDNPNTKPTYYMDVPQFKGCVAFNVYSNSMAPLIEPGSTVFCKKIEDWSVLEFGQTYAIQLNDDRRFVKKIRRNKNDQLFTLQSENKEEYDDFEVEKSKIISVWLVMGWMRKTTE